MRSIRLTRRGWGFAAAALVCFVFSAAAGAPAGLYATGLLLAMVLLGGVFVVVAHARVRVERTFEPEVAEPGEPATVRLTIVNESSWPTPETAWSDHLPRSVAGEARGRIPALGPQGTGDATCEITYQVVSSTRGRHEVGPLVVTATDPFGLVRRTRRHGGEHQLVVLPRRYRLDTIRPGGAGADGATRPAPQYVGVGAEDVIARPYFPGDAIKRLHWKATAHRGELMVRQEEQHDNPRATVVLDLEAAGHGTERVGGRWDYSPGLEWTVSAGASIVTHLTEAGYVVDVAPGRGAPRTIAEGRDTVRELLVDLAEAEPGPPSDPSAVAEDQVTFCVTGVLDVARAERWVRVLGTGPAVHAIVNAGTRPAAREVLAAAGWRVSPYTTQSDIPDAWRALDEASDTTGARHAG